MDVVELVKDEEGKYRLMRVVKLCILFVAILAAGTLCSRCCR